MDWQEILFYLINYKRQKTGLMPQPEDHRDLIYEASGLVEEKIDLRNKLPRITSQNGYNSCVYHAVGTLMDYTLKYKKGVAWDFNFSEAYGWWYGKVRLGTQLTNGGTVLRDAFKVIKEHGFVPQQFWDYKNGIKIEPDTKARIAGQLFKKYLGLIPSYHSLSGVFVTNKVKLIKNALSKEFPVVFGLPTDYDFQNKRDNKLVADISANRDYHAMIIVGFNKEGFLIRNSWGTGWGDHGYCRMDFGLIEDKAFDLWTYM